LDSAEPPRPSPCRSRLRASAPAATTVSSTPAQAVPAPAPASPAAPSSEQGRAAQTAAHQTARMVANRAVFCPVCPPLRRAWRRLSDPAPWQPRLVAFALLNLTCVDRSPSSVVALLPAVASTELSVPADSRLLAPPFTTARGTMSTLISEAPQQAAPLHPKAFALPSCPTFFGRASRARVVARAGRGGSINVL
jgi:hypothetical protein